VAPRADRMSVPTASTRIQTKIPHPDKTTGILNSRFLALAGHPQLMGENLYMGTEPLSKACAWTGAKPYSPKCVEEVFSEIRGTKYL
jgi:hypothetical protein